jgi:K+-sensing histidine kinase KdpD
MGDDRFETIERLIRNLSHELKNPLATIKGYAQLMGARPGEPQIFQKSKTTIIEQIDRIDMMLKSLYGIFSLRVERLEPIDASVLLGKIMRSMAGIDPARMKTTQAGGPVIINADVALFTRMIVLLLGGFDWENNVGSTVELSFAVNNGSCLEVFFKGVDLGDLDENSFYLPFSSRRIYRNGTELYEVYAIARLHGWEFRFSGRYGQKVFIFDFSNPARHG